MSGDSRSDTALKRFITKYGNFNQYLKPKKVLTQPPMKHLRLQFNHEKSGTKLGEGRTVNQSLRHSNSIYGSLLVPAVIL